VADYTELWREIETRLLAAVGLLRADNPNLATRIQPGWQGFLDHNELALALDELLYGVGESGDSRALRRRFWEELLTAAMLMRLSRQFALITDHIPDLEPHTFGVDRRPLHVSCDFNGFIERDVFSLNSVGTALDFARLRLLPAASLRVVLYDADADDGGMPTWLMANADIAEHERWGLIAKADPKSFRTEPR
jgi:hypothetical protein